MVIFPLPKGATFVALLLTLSQVASAAPADSSLAQAECTPSEVDNLLFNVGMETFQSRRDAKSPSSCDWSSDKCSKSPDKPFGFNFVPSCVRHDFGYRNTKNQGRFDEMRSKVDQQFKDDLYSECSQYDGSDSYKGVVCRRSADTYYGAVRTCGDGNCFDSIEDGA